MNEFLNSPYRFIFGLSFFIIFAIVDLIKNPQNPTRAKEYGFFASTCLLASLFAILHDLITFNISKEYFEIGKGLGKIQYFFPSVAILAIKGSYWVGIIVGILFLVMNNSSPRYPQLLYKKLYQILLTPFYFSIVFAFISYILSFYFFPTVTKNISSIKEPKLFENVIFIHYGTYLGALIGTIVGLFQIKLLRIQLRKKISN